MRWIVLFLLSIFLISFASAEIPNDCPNGLVSLWKFDGDAVDSKGDNDGSLSSGGYVDGRVEKAVSLVGTNSVTISDSLTLEPNSGLSIEFWFNKGNLIVPHAWDILNKQGYNVVVDRYTINATIGSAVLTAPISASTDYFVVITWDGANAKMYINKVKQGVDAALTSIDYGTIASNLVVGGSFIGWVDELAIYNRALGQSEIDAHYNLGEVQKQDYCYVSSGYISDTTKNFSLAGCIVPGTTVKLTADSCLRGGINDGLYYCSSKILTNGEPTLLDTIKQGNACTYEKTDGDADGDTRYCCPADRICEARGADTKPYCYQRTQGCGDYGGKTECEENGCDWLDDSGTCIYPNEGSCSVYTKEASCEEDRHNYGQNGVGTDYCGKYLENEIKLDDGTVLSAGYSVDAATCKCEWNSAKTKCYNDAQIIENFCYPIEHCGKFRCSKFFDFGVCTGDGEQEVNWTTILYNVTALPEVIISSESLKKNLSCSDGVVMRSCGQPIVALPFFDFSNFIAAGLLIGLFYLFFREDL